MKCPNCDKGVSPEFNVCPWCGYKPKKCSNPEHQDAWLPAEARFCPRCGEPLIDEGRTNIKDSQTRGDNDSLNANLEFEVGGICFEMVYVEGGTFMMGAQSGDVNEDNYDPESEEDESPVHKVTLSGYHIGESLITQKLWEAVMFYNPSSCKGSENPVDNISWYDCQVFLRKLNRKLRNQLPRGCKFELPTEAQWEFAARGGNESEGYLYSGSDNIVDVAWCGDDCEETYPVMEKHANELGLYDMSGNLWEWCQDEYDDYEEVHHYNSKDLMEDSRRVLRGGSCFSHELDCRVTARYSVKPNEHGSDIGFRIVLQ